LVVQSGRPQSGRLAVRRIGALRFRVYRWRGQPIDRGWVTLSETHEPFAPLATARGLLPGPPLLRLGTFTQVLQAARALHLPAPLPEVLARQEPALEPLDDEFHETEAWLMYHLSRRGDPAI